MKISELPQEIKELALKYQKEGGRSLKIDDLIIAFSWKKTKEGEVFWNDWYTKQVEAFNVEGWYRYNNGNEKDFITKTIVAKSSTQAIKIFTKKFSRIGFFKIEIIK